MIFPAINLHFLISNCHVWWNRTVNGTWSILDVEYPLWGQWFSGHNPILRLLYCHKSCHRSTINPPIFRIQPESSNFPTFFFCFLHYIPAIKSIKFLYDFQRLLGVGGSQTIGSWRLLCSLRFGPQDVSVGGLGYQPAINIKIIR